MAMTAENLRRHLWHSCGGMALPVVYLLLDKPSWMAGFACGLAALAVCLETARLRSPSLNALFLEKIPIAVKEKEQSSFTGSTYFLLGSALTILLFPKPLAVLAVSYLAVGDASAVVVGRSIGKHKILGGTKSLEGSVGCFLACAAVGLLLGWGWLEVSVAIILVGALATTVVELFNWGVDDNVLIPPVAAAVMWAVQVVYLKIF